jgi:predicted XRE-type DNA-binding protein
MNKNKHRGTDFRDFLAEEGILEEVEGRALKRAVAMQLARLIEQQSLSKSDMALRMKTSRAAVDRMLDGSNPSMTLATLEKAARALGRRIKLELIPA